MGVRYVPLLDDIQWKPTINIEKIRNLNGQDAFFCVFSYLSPHRHSFCPLQTSALPRRHEENQFLGVGLLGMLRLIRM